MGGRRLAWLLVAACACSRSKNPDPVETSVVASSSARAPEAIDPALVPAPPVPPAPELPAAPPLDPAPAGEATRTPLATLDREPMLRPFLAKLKEHFAAAPAGPFVVQRTGLASGRTAVLVTRADESDPIVLAVDRDRLVFEKNHPTAGITPPVLHAAIAPGPERGVALFTWVEPMKLVAARMWADDANPYAEIDVFHPEACDALSVAYQATVGWIVACSSKTGTRAQRLRENLTAAWTSAGILVGTAGPVGRARLGFESMAVWTLDQTARAVGGDRPLSFRYSIDATSL